MEIRDAPKFIRAVRMDSVPLGKAYYTEEGYLRDRPILTSVGIFEYMNRDGTIRRELRLPEEVFDADSLASYRGKPVVITHDAGLIDKDNVAENQIGTILSEGRKSGEDVIADIIIHDTDEFKHSRMKELSLGYNLDLDETPGVWNGEHYDAVQRNIRINHLAIVRDARAGEQARLNLDGRDKNFNKGGKKMSKKNSKTRRFDEILTDEELAKALAELDRRRKADGNVDSTEVTETETVENQNGDDDIENRIAAVKECRDRRDEQGDPKDVDEAMGTIAHQDEDIDTLFNIIDTLRAKADFNGGAPAAEVAEDEVDDLETLKGDEDDIDETEESAVEEGTEDVGGEEVAEDVEAADDPAADDEDDELVTDEDDVLDDEDEDDEDDDGFAEDSCDDVASGNRMDAASIDRLVSQKIMLDELGRSIGVKGLAHKSVSDAKKAIIKAVRPEMRLDGKSADYIDAAFSYARAEIKDRKKKNVSTQKRQMFNKDSADERVKSSMCSADEARKRMMERQNNRK